MFMLREEGIYCGSIVNWYLGQAQSGAPYIEFIVSVTHRETEEGDKVPVEKPFSAPVTRYLSPTAIEYSRKDLEYLGYTGTDPYGLDSENPKGFNFRGIPVFVRCKHEEYKEKMQAKWELVRRKKYAEGAQKRAILDSLSSYFAGEQSAPASSENGGGMDAAFSTSFDDGERF